ncbi:hypothetical protein ABOM_012116 [Aspergillus bombycis]|uniref:Nucleoside phosphorylase domain-containing protein n=1 Tax=Aspergillus bombycis TaxID=109264 RepID=A0A1F7ZJW2_9EURO|nr:hypothetical protein ABOM_012116 [Aspergillus bombycis]OGM39418.1 hypothetical protein ABOM_012116 [Aspergillus bombycis]
MRPADRDGFEIGIICAFTLEADALEALFDETYDKFGTRYSKHPRDTNAYITQIIGYHDVVLCYLPGMGTESAADFAANLRISYTHIQLTPVAGICGGVPFPPSNANIVLGDVIISDSVIQFDFGRQYTDEFKRKSDVKETLGRPNLEIRSILAGLQGHLTNKELRDCIYENAQTLQNQVCAVWKCPDGPRDGKGTRKHCFNRLTHTDEIVSRTTLHYVLDRQSYRHSLQP